jgi:Cu+-exporting ATPase
MMIKNLLGKLTQKLNSNQSGQPMQIKTFHIVGMHCTSCSLLIDQAVEEIPGVMSSQTSYAKGQTVVKCEPKKDLDAVVVQTIRQLGYDLQPAVVA